MVVCDSSPAAPLIPIALSAKRSVSCAHVRLTTAETAKKTLTQTYAVLAGPAFVAGAGITRRQSREVLPCGLYVGLDREEIVVGVDACVSPGLRVPGARVACAVVHLSLTARGRRWAALRRQICADQEPPLPPLCAGGKIRRPAAPDLVSCLSRQAEADDGICVPLVPYSAVSGARETALWMVKPAVAKAPEPQPQGVSNARQRATSSLARGHAYHRARLLGCAGSTSWS